MDAPADELPQPGRQGELALLHVLEEPHEPLRILSENARFLLQHAPVDGVKTVEMLERLGRQFPAQ